MGFRYERRGAGLLAAGCVHWCPSCRRQAPLYLALRVVIEDHTFWEKELKDPAVLVLARANRWVIG